MEDIMNDIEDAKNIDIEAVRKNIADIDKEMLKLFLMRMKEAKSVANYKKLRGLKIYDEAQEKKVIQRSMSLIDDENMKAYYKDFIINMMNISKKYQNVLNNGLKVVFAGTDGAFAHIASKKIFPQSKIYHLPSFEAAYKSVENGEYDIAILPIENSFAGEVGQVLDLIYAGSLYVNSVHALRIKQNLLAIDNAHIEDIQKVISHPQAITQCTQYIHEHNFIIEYEQNTALAATKVAKLNDIHIAAIASEETSELYNLKIIDHDINDNLNNNTRFAVLSRVMSEDISNDSFLLFFTLNNDYGSGALLKALTVLSKYNINMKSLKSRPKKEGQYQYYFYLECDLCSNKNDLEKMLSELSLVCDKIKIAGNYKNYVLE